MTDRVIQWASGNVGRHAIRGVADHAHLELVGLYVHGEDKLGKDAGEISGIEPLGVPATNNIEEVLNLKADCIIHAPLPSKIYGDDPNADIDHICRALRSGKNVITVVGYM